jgi:hypothetical protein
MSHSHQTSIAASNPTKDGHLAVANSTAQTLLSYCRSNGWAGYDPYDALNSRLFKALPFLDSRIPRIVLTQVLKRSPINVRPLLAIPKTQNAKAMALFLSAFLRLSPQDVPDKDDLIDLMLERLIALRASGNRYWCWGYSFPWQTRTIIVPVATPNLVCTTFVASALLDAYDQRSDARLLEMAVSAVDYIVNDLYWDDGNSGCGFSYPLPGLHSQTHNANFLAAALFCRVYKHTGDEKYLRLAFRVARYSVGKQLADGSWYYGEADSQRWIDNFHTGYNLCALRAICRDAGTDEFESSIRQGFEFYGTHFIRDDGAARYFHNQTYPIDIHCVAQSIITFLEFADLDERNVDLASSVFHWALDHMWDERGFFYYRVLRLTRIRTSYMRWSQAWMLRALADLVSRRPAISDSQAAHESSREVQTC